MKPTSLRAIAATGVLSLAFIMAVPDALAQAPRPARVAVLDRIVAVVNDDVITRRDLDDRLTMVIKQMKQQGTPVPPAMCSKSSCSSA